MGRGGDNTMAVVDRSSSDEDRGEAALIAAAAKILVGEERGVPPEFVTALFAYAVPEDLMRYGARELAELAADAWAFLAVRKTGTPNIRFASADASGVLPSPLPSTVSVLEVVNDDMPFLVDSVMGELNQRGLEISLVLHPIFTVERDRDGRLVAFKGVQPPGSGALRESFIHIHTERIDAAAKRAEVVEALSKVLRDVRLAVEDWRPMLARLGELIATLKDHPPPLPAIEIAEAVQFLQWLEADNFTFLGMRNYRFTAGAATLEPEFESGLGLLRRPEHGVVQHWNQPLVITPAIRVLLDEPTLLIVTKSGARSRVHRRVYMDYIGVKRFDADGKLIGEFRIVGLFTSTAYTRSTRSIPYLRRKVNAVVRRAGFNPDGHSGKALVNVLETYPRDELFQIDEEALYQFALAILQLDERPRVRVLPRRDRFERYVSVLVYIPRDRYDSRVRAKIGEYLAHTFQGRLRAFYPFFPEGQMVRVHFIIGRYEGETPHVDRATLDRAVEAIVRSWTDAL